MAAIDVWDHALAQLTAATEVASTPFGFACMAQMTSSIVALALLFWGTYSGLNLALGKFLVDSKQTWLLNWGKAYWEQKFKFKALTVYTGTRCYRRIFVCSWLQGFGSAVFIAPCFIGEKYQHNVELSFRFCLTFNAWGFGQFINFQLKVHGNFRA